MARPTQVTPRDVLDFWLEELSQGAWYAVNPDVDRAIRSRFAAAWEDARDGKLEHWRDGPEGALAYLILTDQFSRNMFRGDPRAFATDALARATCKDAIAQGWDQAIPAPERQFFYLPLEHSEDMADQDRAVTQMETGMPPNSAASILHARAHRAVIRRFGRFPYRNVALGRVSTAEEAAFLAEGGYAAMVRAVEDGRET